MTTPCGAMQMARAAPANMSLVRRCYTVGGGSTLSSLGNLYGGRKTILNNSTLSKRDQMRSLRHSLPSGLRISGLDFGLFQVRIHYWREGQNDGDIHNENRPFISFVLRKKLIESRWAINEGSQYERHICGINGADLGVDGLVDVRPITVFIRKAPCIYTMPIGDWHKATAEPGTLTFSIRGRQRIPFAHFLRKPND